MGLESEVRAVVYVDPDHGGIAVPYSPKFIKRIIVGELAAEGDFDFIQKFVAYVNSRIPVEVAYMKDKECGVEIQKSKAPSSSASPP